MKGWKQVGPAIAFKLFVVGVVAFLMVKGFTIEIIEQLTKKD